MTGPIGDAADALTELNCALIELAETMPADRQISQITGRLIRTETSDDPPPTDWRYWVIKHYEQPPGEDSP